MKKLNCILNVLAVTSILLASPAKLMAEERTYEFCNNSQKTAISFIGQSTLVILDSIFTLKEEEVQADLVKISPDGKTVTVSGVEVLAGTCLKAKISTKAMGGPVAHYKFAYQDGVSEDFFPSTFAGEEGTAILSDVIDLQNLNLEREALRTLADSRLAMCKTPTECAEAKNEVIEATASAQAAEQSLNHRLSDMKKYLVPAGAILLGAIGSLLTKQIIHYKKYLKALSDKETCLRTQSVCDEALSILENEKNNLGKVGEEVNAKWGDFVKEHGQVELKNPSAKVDIDLPKYFEAPTPIANDEITVLANLNGLYPRDLRKVEIDMDGRKLPVQFLPKRGLLRATLPNTSTYGEFKASIKAYGDAGVIGERTFTLRKDSTTPKVTITESGKFFAVKVSDEGLGFEGLSLKGTNVRIENPEIKFDVKKKDFEAKVKMLKRPSSLEVKAHKSVVRQNVRSLSNNDEAIATNANSSIKYPEERTPQYPGTTFEELLQKIMGGKQLKGLCCRDSACLFCHPNNLYDCRVLGMSYWKFTDGDEACYKIKPLP